MPYLYISRPFVVYPAPMATDDDDDDGQLPGPGYLTSPLGRGYTHAQIQRDESGTWVTCEWYAAEMRGYARRVEITDGLDLTDWIVERFGAAKYRLAFYRGARAAGFGPPWEIVDPTKPRQPHRIGAPSPPLPPAPASGAAPAWTPPGASAAAPTWVQIQEWQERAATRERDASAERLAAIRADEDERRARREREDDDRRRRDREDMEARALADRARSAADLEQLRERHRLDLERSRQEHEMRLKQLEIERERERERSAPTAEDFAEALEAAEERILASVRPPEAPKNEIMSMLAPHVPTLLGVLQGLAKAAQEAAARPPPTYYAPAPPPQDPPHG